jgi:drug/metabolite transporter (DMT)-like permease
MQKKQYAHLAVLAANFIYGVNYSTVKYITPAVVKPLGLNVIRIAITAVLFWALFLFNPSPVKIRREHWGRLILCAITGVVINQLLFINGLALTFSTHASLIMLTTPILITFIAAWLIKEQITPLRLLGLVLGVSGSLILVTMKEKTGTGGDVVLGDLLIFLNAASYAFYLVLVKPLMLIYKPLHVIRWVFLIGLVCVLPIGWNDFTDTRWQEMQFSHYACLAFIVIGATFFAYLFNMYGLQYLGAGVTGAYIYSQPFFAALVAVLFLQEEIGWQKLLAAALIFTGVYVVSKKTTANA